jgi:hypothetical protein
MDTHQKVKLLAQGENRLQFLTFFHQVPYIAVGGKHLDYFHPGLFQACKLFLKPLTIGVKALMQGKVYRHLRLHGTDALLCTGGKIPLLVVISEINDARHPSVGCTTAAFYEGVGGNRTPAYQVEMGMGIDDSRQHTQAFGVYDFSSLRNLRSFNRCSDTHYFRIFHQDVCMPGPFCINKQSVLNQ